MSKFELFAAIVMGAMLIALPVGVGVLCFYLYRKVKPFPEQSEQLTSFLQLDNIQHDGFIKCSLVGWLICAPIYYLAYRFLAGY